MLSAHGCSFDSSVKVVVHKFGFAERVCGCGKVRVPLVERSFGYSAKKTTSSDSEGGASSKPEQAKEFALEQG